MLLYVCKECGKWCDATLTEALSRVFATLSMAFSTKEEVAPQQGYPCPDGHGDMVLVSAEQRLFVYSAEDGARVALIRPIKEEH